MNKSFGGIAQLGERLHGMQEVRSSILLVSTNLDSDPCGFSHMDFLWFFVKFWGAKVSMHSWRGHALNTVRVLFRCVC